MFFEQNVIEASQLLTFYGWWYISKGHENDILNLKEFYCVTIADAHLIAFKLKAF